MEVGGRELPEDVGPEGTPSGVPAVMAAALPPSVSPRCSLQPLMWSITSSRCVSCVGGRGLHVQLRLLDLPPETLPSPL